MKSVKLPKEPLKPVSDDGIPYLSACGNYHRAKMDAAVSRMGHSAVALRHTRGLSATPDGNSPDNHPIRNR